MNSVGNKEEEENIIRCNESERRPRQKGAPKEQQFTDQKLALHSTIVLDLRPLMQKKNTPNNGNHNKTRESRVCERERRAFCRCDLDPSGVCVDVIVACMMGVVVNSD